MQTNTTISDLSIPVANTFQVLASPARVAILIAIGQGEMCVCHLESILGWRQAYISQHLMALRKAEILLDRREGRYIYYHLADPATLALVENAAQLSGFTPQTVFALANPEPGAGCECPTCAPVLIPLDKIEKR